MNVTGVWPNPDVGSRRNIRSFRAAATRAGRARSAGISNPFGAEGADRTRKFAGIIGDGVGRGPEDRHASRALVPLRRAEERVDLGDSRERRFVNVVLLDLAEEGSTVEGLLPVGIRSSENHRSCTAAMGSNVALPVAAAIDKMISVSRRETLMAGTDLSRHPVHLGLGATAREEPEFTGDMQWYMDYSERHAADGTASQRQRGRRMYQRRLGALPGAGRWYDHQGDARSRSICN
jgi:hypothetical protein